MQPEKVAEVRSWLRKSGDDLRAAEVDLNISPPLIEDALFHCQQACEKSMKAMLTWRYPGDSATPTIDETREAIATARLAVAEIVSRLPAEVRPEA